MLNMIELLMISFLGIIGVIILDKRWFTDVSFSKYEKNLEFFEHFHHGLILMIIGVILYSYDQLLISMGLLFAGFTFIVLEARQKNDFAIHSNHFIKSAAIGIVLLIILIGIYFYYNVMV